MITLFYRLGHAILFVILVLGSVLLGIHFGDIPVWVRVVSIAVLAWAFLFWILWAGLEFVFSILADISTDEQEDDTKIDSDDMNA